MFGLIVMSVIAAYLVASVLVVKKAMRWAEANGRSRKRWGWIAAMTMYLPVFWDHIPTVLLYQYLCATQQGFQVYKTVEQWQRENPGVAETLTPLTGIRLQQIGVIDGYLLNRRFANVLLETRKPVPFLPVSIHEERIVDVATEETMAKQVRIGSGYGNLALGGSRSWKFWLKQPNCDKSSRQQFAAYSRKIKYQGDR